MARKGLLRSAHQQVTQPFVPTLPARAWKLRTPAAIAQAPRKGGELCAPWRPARGHNKAGSAVRGRCPVQLDVRGGRYAVRFCRQFGEPGRLITVQDAREATQVTRALCREWLARSGHKTLPVPVEDSRRAADNIYTTDLADKPLGRARRRRGRSRSRSRRS